MHTTAFILLAMQRSASSGHAMNMIMGITSLALLALWCFIAYEMWRAKGSA